MNITEQKECRRTVTVRVCACVRVLYYSRSRVKLGGPSSWKRRSDVTELAIWTWYMMYNSVCVPMRVRLRVVLIRIV